MAAAECVLGHVAQPVASRDRADRRDRNGDLPGDERSSNWNGVLIRPRQQAGHRECHRRCRCRAQANGSRGSGFGTPRATRIAESAQSVRLRLDDSPPVLAFKPLDAADPTRIDVRASDSTSPLARTELEIRRRGEARWLPVPTTTSADGFSGRLDDETPSQRRLRPSRAGVRQRRQRAVDRPGDLRRRRDAQGAGAHQHAARGGTGQARHRAPLARRQASHPPSDRRAADGSVRAHDPDPRTPHDARRQPGGRRSRRGLGARTLGRRRVATHRADRHRRGRPLQVQGAARTEPRAAVPLSRHTACPSADH